jgi:GTPase SAR1 family protein
MGTPLGASARYTVVPVLGPDGVGKTSLVRAFGDYVWRRDGVPAVPLRAVPNATVLDARAPYGVFQLVDFASAAAEEAIFGTSQFQGALLVVDATNSVTPGTVRSVTRAREFHVPRMAVALTKCDLVEDPEILDLVTMEIRDLLSKNGFGGERDDAPVGAVTAFSAEGGRTQAMIELPSFFESVVRWIG